MNGAVKAEKYYTYEEWLEIDDGNRYELINGTLHMMASPSPGHQAISAEFTRQLGNYLMGKPCRVYPALDVRLRKDEDTAFEPDVIVVCDPSKITKRCCEGVQDLIIEILSPSTASYDKFTKFYEYLHAGVLEYWVVSPEDKTVTAYRLIDKKYVADVYTDTAPVQTLPGCEVDLSLVFRE